MASFAVGSAKKGPGREKHVDKTSAEVCNISVIVDDHKKVGGFVLKQLESEVNKIFATGGANIHATFVAAGRADYALRIQDVAPKNNVEGEILGQTSKQDPHNSFVFVESIENVWRQQGTLPRGGRGIVYGRVYAHELAAHGILGWEHSQPGDREMGFLGSGRNWGDFLFNNNDDSKFELSPASGRLLNLRCRFANRSEGLDFSKPADKKTEKKTEEVGQPSPESRKDD